MYDQIIYGKNQTEKIVSLEVEDAITTIFTSEGQQLTFPNKFWILSPTPMNNAIRLKGDLYYKWGWQTQDRQHFLKMRNILRKNDVFSIYNAKEAIMVKDGFTYHKGLKPQDLAVLSYDIETTGLAHDDTAKLLIIANTFRDRKGNITRKLFCYDEYNNEGELLEAWCSWVCDVDPDVMLGHNINCYDNPYLNFIANRAGVPLRLGRNKSVIKFDRNESSFRKDGSQTIEYKRAHIFGREIIDTMFLSIKYDFAREFPNYRLKDIIAFLGKEIEGRQHYDAATIKNNYQKPEEWLKIKTYATHDGDDPLTLFELMVAPYFYLAQTVPKSFQHITESATGSQINAVLLRAYLQQGHSLPRTTQKEKFAGAISFGVPGIYENAFKIDVASLYPSIMIEYNVEDKLKDPFGYFQHLVKTFTAKRLFHKGLAKTDKYHKDLSEAYKIFINSCYGFLGTNGLLFNSPKNAAFVTEKGREVLMKAIEWAEGKTYEDWKKENHIQEEIENTDTEDEGGDLATL